MYAIVEIAGQQFKVEEGKKIFVHRLKAEDGQNVEFDQVLLIEDKGNIVVGEPLVKDAVVEAKVLEHLKGDKVIVFKKKRRKGYRVKNGHRQYFTKVEIVSIKKEAARKEPVKKEEPAGTVHEDVEPVEKPVKTVRKSVAKEGKSETKKPAVRKKTDKSKE